MDQVCPLNTTRLIETSLPFVVSLHTSRLRASGIYCSHALAPAIRVHALTNNWVQRIAPFLNCAEIHHSLRYQPQHSITNEYERSIVAGRIRRFFEHLVNVRNNIIARILGEL
jgi:hypothetical protein